MTRKSRAILAIALGLTTWVVAAATPASALSLTGDYFILGGSHPDTLGGIDGGVVAGLVGGNLAPGASPTYTGLLPPASGAISDLSAPCVPGPCGQIRWWTAHGAGATGVALQTAGHLDTGTATSFLPTSFGSNFYAQGGSDGGANGFRAVHWTGSFHASGLVDLSLTSDDDAWLFFRSHGGGNYSLLLDSGGVKDISLTDPVHQTHLGLAPGDYDVQLFFADRHVTQSGVTFLCTTHPGEGGGTCTDLAPIPEPTTLLLLGSSLVGLGTIVRRRMKGGKEAV